MMSPRNKGRCKSIPTGSPSYWRAAADMARDRRTRGGLAAGIRTLGAKGRRPRAVLSLNSDRYLDPSLRPGGPHVIVPLNIRWSPPKMKMRAALPRQHLFVDKHLPRRPRLAKAIPTEAGLCGRRETRWECKVTRLIGRSTRCRMRCRSADLAASSTWRHHGRSKGVMLSHGNLWSTR